VTTKKKASTGEKLKLKKETLKDLGVKNGAKGVKGGFLFSVGGCRYTAVCKSAGCDIG
jgi:hypothetical protein